MRDPAEYIHEFDVSPEDLTDEQIDKLNSKSRVITRVLVISFFLLPVISWVLLIKIFGSLGVSAIPNSNEELSNWQSVIYFLPIAIFYFVSYKLYKLIGHFIIGSMVKAARLKNLEAKVNKLDNQLNPPITEKPISPKVQKEIDKIRAFGKNK